MQIAPAFAPGSVAAGLKSITTGERTVVIAAAPLEPVSRFATREEAFRAAYQASLGAERGALLIGHDAQGFSVQDLLVRPLQAPDSPGTRFDLEAMAIGDRPLVGARGAGAAFVAIIDGAAIIVPRD